MTGRNIATLLSCACSIELFYGFNLFDEIGLLCFFLVFILYLPSLGITYNELTRLKIAFTHLFFEMQQQDDQTDEDTYAQKTGTCQ